MKQLRKRKMKKVRIFMIIFAVCGAVFCAFQYMFLGAKSYKDWEDLDWNRDMDSVYVTHMEPDLEGPYYEENLEEDEKIAYYFVWLDERRVFPLYVMEYDAVEEAESYAAAKKQWRDGAISDEALAGYRMAGTGKIYDTSETEHLKELQAYIESQPEYAGGQIEVVPYTMQMITIDSRHMTSGIFGGFIAVCVIAICICLIRTNTKWGEKMIETYCQDQGDTDALRHKIDSFFATQEIVPGGWVDTNYIAGLYNTTTIFAETKNLSWAYVLEKNVITGDAGSTIAVALTSSPATLKLHFKDKKSYELQLSSVADAEQILSYLRQNCSWVVTEYSEEIKSKYHRNEYPF